MPSVSRYCFDKGGKPRLLYMGYLLRGPANSRFYLLAGPDLEDTSKDKNMRNKKAFTLIELLVVVLIIGILAAVALPQYNKAVKKAQGAEALAAMDAVEKALTVYFLETGGISGNERMNENQLYITMPELKHFHFSVGSNGEYGSSHILGEIMSQIGTSIQFLNIENNDIRVRLNVHNIQKNKKSPRTCTALGPTSSCSDYFNCNAEPRQPLGSIYIGGDCDLL